MSETKWTISSMLRPYCPQIALIVVIQLIGVFLQVETISLLRPILDASVHRENIDLLMSLSATLILLTIIVSLILATTSYLASKIASAVSESLRMKIMTAAVSTNDIETMGESTTSTMTCLINDVNSVQRYVFETLRTYLPMPVLMALLFYYAFLINDTIGILMAVTMFAAMILTYVFSSRIHPLYSKQVDAVDNVNRCLREKINGSRTIRAYDGVEYEEEKFAGYSTVLGTYNRKVTLGSYAVPYISTAFLWLYIVFMFVALVLDESGKIVPYVMIVFMQYVTFIVSTMAIVPYLALGTPRARICFRRLRDTVSASDIGKVYKEPVVVETDNIFHAENLTVDSSYGKPTVDDVSMVIGKGEVVTILGPNGCGASDLFNAAMGFKNYGSGRILIDGMDPSVTDPAVIRDVVAYASNGMHIFRGTLRYNLDPHSSHTDDEILSLCNRIGLGRLISDMPEGLDTHINDELSSMSGGQRLLVIMARCLLHDAKLYVFDDCFFSLDQQTRAMALDTVMDVCKGSAVVFLMHDMSTATVSDRVFLMDKGKVRDMGTHEVLIGRSELYINLYKASQGRDGSWA